MSFQNIDISTGSPSLTAKTRLTWFTDEGREELAKRHYHLLINIARTWDIPEPADAASNAILRALRDFDPDKGLFIGLARKALHFEILDQRRRLARRPLPERLPEDFEIEAPEIHHFSDKGELDRQIHDAWVTLNLVDQRLLWLRIVAGFTFKEIGLQLDFVGCPIHPVTMRSRVGRAIRRLIVCRDNFDDIEFSDIADSIHRVAKASGTLDFTPSRPKRSSRSRARRAAAQKRCKRHTNNVRRSQRVLPVEPET